MLEPYRVDEFGVGYFKLASVQEFGRPEEWGWLGAYNVIAEEEDSHPRICTFKSSEAYHFIKPREVHHYCRISRFRSVLKHMMGLGGFSTRKSLDTLDEIAFELPINIKYTPPCLIWDAIWKLLKTNNISKYYSRIPTIIKKLKLGEFKSNNCVGVFIKVMDDFKDMDRVFEQVKESMDRKYFPSLRFIALKLLKRHNFDMPIAVPYARTSIKVDRLESDYDIFWNKLRELESEELKDFFEF